MTLVAVSITTALFVRMSLRLPDPNSTHGHQDGNLAVMSGAVLAALAYTPILAFFVWDFQWWLSLLITPTAFITAMPGLILASPLLKIAERIAPTDFDT